MKRRINELLNERFIYEPDKLRISAEKIEQSIQRGKRLRGRFSISAPSGRPVQGFLYSTNSRVKFSPELFVGREETITYEADPEGLLPGDSLEGAFVICTVCGEYTLPYTFRVETLPEEDAPAQPITCAQFAALAREDFSKAYMLFASRQFPERIRDDVSWRPLYEGIAGQSMSFHSMEQFLVGLGLKEPVTVSMDKTHLCLGGPAESEREELILTKNTWGFAALKISSDAPFLAVERPEVTTEEFVGSVYRLGFVIQKEKLHAGRNFARITVRTGCRTAVCTVEVRRAPESAARDGRFKKQEILQMMNAYIRRCAGALGEREWCRMSLTNLDNICKAGGDSIFFALYRVWLLFLSGWTAEAQSCLQEIAERKKELMIPQWKACYLFLTTLWNREKEYVDHVREEIQGLMLANRENWMIQWLILHEMGDSFRNDSERLDAVRRQYSYGCKSPVLYLEGWRILRREPLMLRKLDDFEVHLLGFLCREKLLDREICGQAAQLAGHAAYQPLLVRVLCRCYEQFPGKNLLTAICSLLMKGHRNGPEQERWFRLGVEQDLRLAGLYEYYAQTAQDLGTRELPQTVRLYFSYNNTLDNDKKAAIYANVIRGRERDPQMYETYLPAMERFMEEQLAEGRVSEDLALLYQTLLERYPMDERLLAGLSRVLFTCEAVCENPQIRHLIALHGQLASGQRQQFAEGRAHFQKYSPDCCVLLEDRDGVLYADRSLFSERRLLADCALENKCRELREVPESLLLHDLALQDGITRDNAPLFVQYTRLPRVREEYRRWAQEKLLLYYAGNVREDGLREYLQSADLAWLAERRMRELTELLVSEGMTEKALQLVKTYGAERVDTGTLVRLCSHSLEDRNGEDAELLALCAQCFARGTYDEAVLRYLIQWYEGPVGTMKALWQAGRRFGLEAYALEERILVLVLFMGAGMEGTEPVFEAYWKQQGRAKICRAYAIWMAYRSFVKEERVGEPVFDYIGRTMGAGNAPKICQLALLAHCAGDRKLDAAQQERIARLLEKFTLQGMYFRFYQEFPIRLLRRLHLHDKYILEYRTDPKNRVTLHYRLNGGRECAVPMSHMYEGIFAHAFTLFYQDRLEWYMSVESERGTERTARQSVTCGRRANRGSTGRYELINRYAEALQRNDQAQLRQIREQYVGQQYLVDELFQIN